MKDARQTPKEFMQELRPEHYSDSRVVKKAILHRALLEYYLDTLTSRNQERDFETFCVKLAQFEIAPNLRMQTGPVGGGDAKADTENYPVSHGFLQQYWEGGSTSADERWAFAISAMKDWSSKIKKDIKNIISTGRGYQKIFFISNQFIKDKNRAKIEDELGNTYGIRVIILDRNWILDKIFGNKRELLAVTELRMGENLLEEVETGPTDFQRQRRVSELESEVEHMLALDIVNSELVHKLIEQALLSAELNLPAPKISNLFDRAIKFAEQTRVVDCIFLANYQKAWCAIFYLEQYNLVLPIYRQLEVYAIESENIFRAEYLMNLFNVMAAMHDSTAIISKEELIERRKVLQSIISNIADDNTKPSSSLLAQTMLILLDLIRPEFSIETLPNCLLKLHKIITNCDGMIGFPWDQTIEMIEIMGQAYGEVPEFESLMSLIFQKTEKRKGEIPSALSQFKFGKQHLEANRPYKAIQFIGNSLFGLHKQESKEDFYFAMAILGQAYIKIDMLWAARGILLNTISPLIGDWNKFNVPPVRLIEMYERLRWLELSLGRIGPALRFHKLYFDIKMDRFDGNAEEISQLQRSNVNFDQVLMMLILKTSDEDMPQLQKLSDTLFRVELYHTDYATLYLLGGKKYLPEEITQTELELFEIYSKWLEVPEQAEIPARPLFYNENRIELKSKILGGYVEIDTINDSCAIVLAESILASLESFLPPLLHHNALAKNDNYRITINRITNAETCPIILLEEIDNDSLSIGYAIIDHHKLDRDAQDFIKSKIHNIILTIVPWNYTLPESVFCSQETQTSLIRSIHFTGSFLILGNATFSNPCYKVDQIVSASSTFYEYLPPAQPRLDITRLPNLKGSQDNGNILDKEAIRQTNIEVNILINNELWLQAGLQGICYGIPAVPSAEGNLLLMPLFTNAEAGKNIFKRWHSRFGDEIKNKIIIYLIKGVNKDHPSWYSFTIVPADIKSKSNYRSYLFSYQFVSTAENTARLEEFISAFKPKYGCFFAPGYYQTGMKQPEVYQEYGFQLTNIIFKEAWEIGAEDPAIVGLTPGTLPHIPEDVKNPPIENVLNGHPYFARKG